MTGPPGVLPVEPDLTGTLRRAAPLLRPHRWWLIGAGAVGVLATVAELGTPVLAGLAVDAVVDGERDRLRQVAVAFAVLAVVAFLAERARLLLTAAAGERVLLDLRNRVADALLTQPLRFFDLHPPGQLVARATTDVSAFSEFVRHGLRSLVNVVLLLVVTVVVLFATSWQLALVALVVVPAALPSIRGFHRASTAAYARYAQGEADVTAAVAELVEARETVQSTATGPAALARAGAPDEEMLAANDDALRAENRLAAVEFWQLAAVAAVVAAGGLMADRGVVSAGAIATTALAVRQLFDPLADLGHLYGSALEARVRLARVLDLVDAAPARPSTSTPSADGGVELHGVHFAYVPERPVLHDVRLRVGPGEHVALVGPTGAGKSTVAKLAAGLLEPDSGEVRGSAGVIFLPQEAHLVAGTLADNLRVVPGAHTDADLHAAIAAAGLGPWLAGLPDGLDTVLDHRGGNLSAGERQLVALARAALADPAVLILDEATADIDPATDALVSAALGRLGAGRTLIVIAHRPATATRYPRVIRIAAGRVTADGPPQEVLAT